MTVHCPNCFRPIEQRGYRLHLASCKADTPYPAITPMNGWPLPSISNICWFAAQIIMLSLALFIGYQICKPLFWFWSSLWSIFSAAKDVGVKISDVMDLTPNEYA